MTDPWAGETDAHMQANRAALRQRGLVRRLWGRKPKAKPQDASEAEALRKRVAELTVQLATLTTERNEWRDKALANRRGKARPTQETHSPGQRKSTDAPERHKPRTWHARRFHTSAKSIIGGCEAVRMADGTKAPVNLQGGRHARD